MNITIISNQTPSINIQNEVIKMLDEVSNRYRVMQVIYAKGINPRQETNIDIISSLTVYVRVPRAKSMSDNDIVENSLMKYLCRNEYAHSISLDNIGTDIIEINVKYTI